MGTPIEGGEVQGGNPDAGDNTPGPNPAWNDVLSVLPEQFHQMVTPHFQKWDDAANQRIESVNSQLKEFESYKPFAEHGITSDEIEQGLRILYEVNNNPQNVYNALQSAYNFGQQQTTTEAANEETDEENSAGLPPEVMEKLSQHDGLLQAVSQIILNDAKAKQDAQADMALETELNKLKETHGDYDEDYVLTKMMSGMSGEDAVKSYQALVQNLSPKPFAPTVLSNSGGGAGVPSNAIDPTKLSGKETRNLVAQMLAAEFGKKA
jgi:hypothetical protein